MEKIEFKSLMYLYRTPQQNKNCEKQKRKEVGESKKQGFVEAWSELIGRQDWPLMWGSFQLQPLCLQLIKFLTNKHSFHGMNLIVHG